MKYKALLGLSVSLVILTAVLSSFLRVYPSIITAQNSEQSSPQSLTETLPESISIKAVGDMVPGTNYGSNSLPGTPNQLFSLPIREKL